MQKAVGMGLAVVGVLVILLVIFFSNKHPLTNLKPEESTSKSSSSGSEFDELASKTPSNTDTQQLFECMATYDGSSLSQRKECEKQVADGTVVQWKMTANDAPEESANGYILHPILMADFITIHITPRTSQEKAFLENIGRTSPFEFKGIISKGNSNSPITISPAILIMPKAASPEPIVSVKLTADQTVQAARAKEVDRARQQAEFDLDRSFNSNKTPEERAAYIKNATKKAYDDFNQEYDYYAKDGDVDNTPASSVATPTPTESSAVPAATQSAPSPKTVAVAQPLIQSTSFNCALARTNIEKTICSDPQLIAADSKLNSVYKVLKKSDELKHSQRDWLHIRNQCSDAKCISAVYKTRIDELSGRLSGEQTQ